MKTDKACVYDIVLKGEVVYVGMTNDPDRRLKQHRVTGVAPKGAEMHVFKWFDTRIEAFEAEYFRQGDLLPPFCADRSYGEKPEKIEFDWDEYRRKLKEIQDSLTADDLAYIDRLYNEHMEKYRAA